MVCNGKIESISMTSQPFENWRQLVFALCLVIYYGTQTPCGCLKFPGLYECAEALVSLPLTPSWNVIPKFSHPRNFYFSSEARSLLFHNFCVLDVSLPMPI